MRNLVNDMYMVTVYGYDPATQDQDPDPYDTFEIGDLLAAIGKAESEWSLSGCGNHVILTDPNENVIVEFWPTGQAKGFNPVEDHILLGH